MRAAASLLLVLLIASDRPAVAQEPSDKPTLEVIGTQFRVTMLGGRALTSVDLRGASLEVTDDAGRRMTVRIDAVIQDASDVDGDVCLHRF